MRFNTIDQVNNEEWYSLGWGRGQLWHTCAVRPITSASWSGNIPDSSVPGWASGASSGFHPPTHLRTLLPPSQGLRSGPVTWPVMGRTGGMPPPAPSTPCLPHQVPHCRWVTGVGFCLTLTSTKLHSQKVWLTAGLNILIEVSDVCACLCVCVCVCVCLGK